MISRVNKAIDFSDHKLSFKTTTTLLVYAVSERTLKRIIIRTQRTIHLQQQYNVNRVVLYHVEPTTLGAVLNSEVMYTYTYVCTIIVILQIPVSIIP